MSNSEGNYFKTAGTRSVFSMISKPQNGLLSSGMWNLEHEKLRHCSRKSLACRNKYLQGWAENPEVLSEFLLEAGQNQAVRLQTPSLAPGMHLSTGRIQIQSVSLLKIPWKKTIQQELLEACLVSNKETAASQM